MRKTIIAKGKNATPFESALDVVRGLLSKGTPINKAIEKAQKLKGPMTSKELEDAKNLTVHPPVVYIKPQVEPTTLANSIELPIEVKRLLGTKILYENGSKERIHRWEQTLEHHVNTSYLQLLADGVIEWVKSTVKMKGTYSRNRYKLGLRGKDLQTEEPCWELKLVGHTQIEHDKPKSSNYARCRYLWKNHSLSFSSFESSFVKNVGAALSAGKPLTRSQLVTLESIFKKYKVPDSAVAARIYVGD